MLTTQNYTEELYSIKDIIKFGNLVNIIQQTITNDKLKQGINSSSLF